MARINVEDDLWADDRFMRLIEMLGDRAAAIGTVVLAFRMAQKYWVPDRHPIPKPAFESFPRYQEMINCGLAEVVNGGDFIYIKGSEKQFAWLLQKINAGSNGGKAKSRNHKEISLAASSGGLAASSGVYPLTLTPPLTPTLSLTQNKKEQNKYVPGGSPNDPPRRPKRDTASLEHNRQTWEAYRTAFVARYKVEPVRNATVNTQVSQLGKRLGQDAPSVAAFYLSHNKSFYLAKQHMVGLLLADAESLYTQWKRDRPVTESDVRAYEKHSQYDRLRAMVDKGEI